MITGDTGADDTVTDDESKPLRRAHRFREGIRGNSSLNLAYRIAVGVVGTIVLIAGLLMVPYPGPGWLVVFAGLGILATEFEWAHRLLRFAKSRYDKFEVWFRRQPIWVKGLSALFVSVVTILSLWLLGALAMGAGWIGIDWPWLKSPFAS